MASDWLIKEIKNFKNIKTPTLEILHEVQKKEGYISKENCEYISKELNIPLSKIYSTITFYSEFKLNKRGKNLIRVCLGTACRVMHNKENVEFIKKELKLNPNETTKDNMFTFETVNCFGTCSLAPVVEINGKIYAKVTPEKIKKLINDIKKNEK
jgi:NADH:ubiquinone oxidoreductase subunit E